MKKIVALLIILCLVMTLAFTLIACVVEKPDPKPPIVDPPVDPDEPEPDPEPDPEDPNRMYLTINEVFELMGKSFATSDSSETISFVTAIDIEVGQKDADGKPINKPYMACFNGNINASGKDTELCFTINEKKTLTAAEIAAINAIQDEKKRETERINKEKGKTICGLIIVNNKMFIEIDGVKVYLENMDINYIVKLLSTILPILPSELDKLLSGIGFSIDMIIGLVMPMLFSYPVSYFDGTTYDIAFEVTISSLLDFVIGIVKGLNIDGLLQGAGVKLPDGISISGIIDMIKIPQFYINVETKMERTGYTDKGEELVKSNYLDVSIKDKYMDNILHARGAAKVSSDKQDIGIPNNLSDYEPFSITHMQFEVGLAANIGNNGTMLDVGKLVNAFAGKQFLPEDTITVQADIGITLKFQLDINLSSNAENFLLIEAYMGNDTSIASKRLVGIYFMNNEIMINVDQISPIYKGKNIKILTGDMDITGKDGILTHYLSMVEKLIDDALKGIIGEDKTDAQSVAHRAGYNDGDLILAMSSNSDGDLFSEGGLLNLINGILGSVKFDKFVVLTAENGIVIQTFEDNDPTKQSIFDVIATFAPDIKDTLDNIKGMIGAARIGVNMKDFNVFAIENITIDWKQSPDLGIGINVGNMKFGFAPDNIRQNIIDATAGKEYASNVQDLITDIMKGVDIKASLKLHIPEGKHNIIDLIKGLGIPSLELPLDGAILDIPAGGVTLDLELIIQFQFDMQNKNNSKAKIEIHNKKKFLYFNEGLLIGIYAQGDRVYADLSGIELYGFRLPRVSMQLDLMGMLAKELSKIDINLILSDLLKDMLPKPTGGDQGKASQVNDASRNGGGINDRICLEINEDSLKLKITGIALSKLLAVFDVNITLPNFDIRLEVTELKNITLGIGLDISPGKALTIDAKLEQMELGSALEIVMPDFDTQDYMQNLNDFVSGAINKALSGMSIDFNLKLTLPNGKFLIGELLSNLGVVGIDDFVLQVGDPLNPQDVVLDCKLQFRAAFVRDNPETTDIDESKRSKMSIEIILNQSIMGIKAGKIMSVYADNGKMYIDLSGLLIDKMPMPRLSVDLHLAGILMNEIGSIDLDKLLEPILRKAGLLSDSGASKVSDTYAMDPADYPILSLNENSIAIIATAKALESILKAAGVNLTGLPDFTANIEISAIEGLKLTINDCALLSLDLSITDIKIGVPVEVPLDGVNDENYPSSITQVVTETVSKILGGTQATFGIKLKVDPMIIYLDDLFKLFGLTIGGDGENLYAINITETLILDLELKLKLQYNEFHPEASIFALEIYLKNDFFLQAGGGMKAGLLIGVYGVDGKTFIDMSGLKLGEARFPKFVLNLDIMSMMVKEIEKLLLAENIDDILNGKIDAINPKAADNNIAPVSDVIVDGDKPTISINQDSLGLKMTSIALFNLLSSFGVDFTLPFDFDLSLDLNLGELQNGLKIEIKTNNDGLAEALYNFEGSIFIGDFKFGRSNILVEGDYPDAAERATYATTIKDALTTAVNNLLDGATLTAGLKVTLFTKKYNVGEYLKMFIDTNLMSNLYLDITHDQTLDLRMEFRFRSRSHTTDGVINPRGMSLEFYLSRAPLFINDLVYDPLKPIISIIGDADGKTYLDLSNLVLSAHVSGGVKKGVRLPKIVLDIDILDTIEKVMGKADVLDSMLNDALAALNKKPSTEKVNDSTTNAEGDGNDELEFGKYLDLGITDKRLDIEVTAEAIATILKMAGLAIDLPPITLQGSLDVGSADQVGSNGLMLGVKLYNMGDTNLRTPIASMDINFKDIRLGEHATVNIRKLTQEDKNDFSQTLNAGLQDGLKNILTGADLSATFEIRLPAGKYNIAALLGVFNVDAGIIPITLPDITFTSPVNIVVKMSFVVETFDPQNPQNNKFVLKLTLMEDLIPYVINGGERGAVIKAGTDLIKIFAVGDNKTYVDLSGLTLANISLPRIYLDVDVLNLLNMLIESQDLDKLLKDYLDTAINPPKDGGNNSEGEDKGTGGAEGVADADIIDFPIDVTLAQKYIKFTATSKALFQMMEGFGLNIALPDALSFDITGQLNGFGVYDPNSLEINVNLDKFDGLGNDLQWIDGKYMAKVKLSLGKLNFDSNAKIPAAEMDSLIKAAEAIKAESGDRLKFAIYDIIKTVDLEIGMKLNLSQTKVSLTKMINTFLASSGQYIDLPINMKIDNIDQEVKLAIKWNLDFRKHENSEAYIMLYTEDLTFEVRLVYKNNTLYIDMSRLGLVQIKISKFNLTAMIDKLVGDMLPVLNTDITDMLMNLLFPNNNNGDNNDDSNSEILGVNSAQKNAANYMGAVGQQTKLQDGINQASNSVDIMDILNILLSSLKIEDLIATIGLDNTMLSGILAQVGIGLGVPLSAEGGLFLPEGALALDLSIDGMGLGMSIKLNKLGGPKRYIDWLYFTERFLTRAENPRKTAAEDLPKQQEPAELANYFLNHGEYSLLSGYDLVMSMFTSLRRDDNPSFGADGHPALFKLNLHNVSQASMSLADGSGYISAKVFRVTDYSRSIAGRYNARRGSIIIELYKGVDIGRCMVVVAIDSVNGVIQILGTPNLFSVGSNLISGNLVTVPIYANLAVVLGDLLDPIVKMIPDGIYGGGISGTPTSDVAAAAEEGGLPFDIMGMIKDITVTLMNSGHVRIFADLEATALNDMLIDMLDNLFKTMQIPDLVGHNNPLNIPYKSTLDSSSAFFDEFWNKLMLPLVAKNVSGALNDLGLTNLVKGQISDVVKRILPLARFDRLNLTVNVLNGKVADAAVVTQRKIPGRIYDNNNLPEPDDTSAWDRERLQIEFYNMEAKEEVEWSRMATVDGTTSHYNEKNQLSQSTNVIYDPYAESNNDVRDPSNLASHFVTGARRYSEEQSRYGVENTGYVGSKSKVTWHVMNPTSKGYTRLNAQPVDNPMLLYRDTQYNTKLANYRNSSKAFNDQILSSTFAATYGTVDGTTGAIVYTMKGVADSFKYRVDGTDYNSEIIVKLTVLPKSSDLAGALIEDVMVSEHGTLPNKVTMGMNVILPGGATTYVKRVVDVVIKNGSRSKPYADDEIITKDPINPTSGPHVVVGGQAIGVNIHYISSKVTGYNRVLTIDAYKKNDFTATLPSRMYFTYASGAYNSARVEWNTKELEALTTDQWQDGTPKDKPIILKARVLDEINLGTGGADTRQEVEFEVHILSTRPQSVEFEGELFNNTVSVDPFDIIASKKNNRIAEDILPKVATVVYKDGHTDQQQVTWFEITEENGYIPVTQALLDSVCSANGGEYRGKLAVVNKNGDIVWQHLDVLMNVLRRVPSYIKFGTNPDGSNIKTLTINPYDALLNGIEKVMPPKADVVFEQGDVRSLNVVWDTTSIDITPDGGTFLVPVTVERGTPLERKFTVPVKVQKMEIAGLAYENNTYVFDYAPEILYGGKTMADYKPTTLKVVSKSGQVFEVPAKIDFDNVDVNINGINTYATAIIGEGAYEQQYMFNVVVPKPEIVGVQAGYEDYWVEMDEIRNLAIDSYPKNYKVKFAHYNGSTIIKELPITSWNLSQTSTIKRETMTINGQQYSVEVPGSGGVMYGRVADANNANAQFVPVNLKIAQNVKKIAEVSKKVVIDYATNPTGELPEKLFFNVDTIKIDSFSAKTAHNYDKETSVDWNVGNYNFLDNGSVEAIVMKGSKFEQRFDVNVEVRNAPLTANIRLKSNQAVTFSYQEFVKSGVKVLPNTLYWEFLNAGGSVTATKEIATSWTTADINLKIATIINGVATLDVNVYFGKAGADPIEGTQQVVITNIPQLASNAVATDIDYAKFKESPSSVFLPDIKVLINIDGKLVSVDQKVTYNIAQLNNDLAANASLDTPEATINSKVTVIINGGTIHEVRYVLDITVNNITQQN